MLEEVSIESLSNDFISKQLIDQIVHLVIIKTFVSIGFVAEQATNLH